MSEADYRRYYMSGGSATVDFYSLFHDSLRRALVNGNLTTTPTPAQTP